MLTNNQRRKVFEHKNDFGEGFTKKYRVHILGYYEDCHDVESVIQGERQMEKWNRRWKITTIEKQNPEWRDLYDEIA